jgi:hypothetical protein
MNIEMMVHDGGRQANADPVHFIIGSDTFRILNIGINL